MLLLLQQMVLLLQRQAQLPAAYRARLRKIKLPLVALTTSDTVAAISHRARVALEMALAKPCHLRSGTMSVLLSSIALFATTTKHLEPKHWLCVALCTAVLADCVLHGTGATLARKIKQWSVARLSDRLLHRYELQRFAECSFVISCDAIAGFVDHFVLLRVIRCEQHAGSASSTITFSQVIEAQVNVKLRTRANRQQEGVSQGTVA